MNQGNNIEQPGEPETAVERLRVPAHFIWRRIHSLSGIVPLGIFLVIHFAVAASAMGGKDAYNSVQGFINRIPLLVPLQVVIILLPLLFHAVYGILIFAKERNNPFTYPYLDNWRYALQRVSGLYLILFLALHLGNLWIKASFTRMGHEAFMASPFDFVAPHLQDHSYMVVTVLAVVAASFHLTQGIWTFCNTWGITITDRARRMLGWGMGVLFAVLVYFGFMAVMEFYSGHPAWPLPGG